MFPSAKTKTKVFNIEKEKEVPVFHPTRGTYFIQEGEAWGGGGTPVCSPICAATQKSRVVKWKLHKYGQKCEHDYLFCRDYFSMFFGPKKVFLLSCLPFPWTEYGEPAVLKLKTSASQHKHLRYGVRKHCLTLGRGCAVTSTLNESHAVPEYSVPEYSTVLKEEAQVKKSWL